MDVREFAERIYLNLKYAPTDQQIELIGALAQFCSPEMPDDSVFLLCGYAGTGKTSLISALTNALREASVPTVLMAPTGRAAKVLSEMSGLRATTIHRRIYHAPADGAPLRYGSGEVAENTLRGAVFIVDEASMIGDESGYSQSSLLEDLIQYVYTGEGCKMILLGDTAQLPPVGCEVSPAMEPKILRSFGLRVTRAVLTRTVRQASDSGILYNATRLRHSLRRLEATQTPLPEPQIVVRGFNDVEVVQGEELEDIISSAYSEYGEAGTLLVTRSNRRAKLYSLAIRQKILGREEELCKGERLLVARNNYLWSAKIKGLDFIANGDMATVESVYGVEEKYGLRFADVRLSLTDRGGIEFDCKIMLDSLLSDAVSLEPERLNKLYNDILTDPDVFSDYTPMKIRMKMLRSDPYWGALQVKYAYAVTCHKSQGGQWPKVFVDMAGISSDAVKTVDFYRWLYTAVTRATVEVSFISPQLKIID